MSTPRILVADDSSTIRTQVAQILTAHGYEVDVACDGQSAVQHARDNTPTLMILDVTMPSLDGFGVCLELRRMGPPLCDVPIVFLTSSQSHALEILGEEMGAYLHKPVQEAELLKAVQSFVPNQPQPC